MSFNAIREKKVLTKISEFTMYGVDFFQIYVQQVEVRT